MQIENSYRRHFSWGHVLKSSRSQVQHDIANVLLAIAILVHSETLQLDGCSLKPVLMQGFLTQLPGQLCVELGCFAVKHWIRGQMFSIKTGFDDQLLASPLGKFSPCEKVVRKGQSGNLCSPLIIFGGCKIQWFLCIFTISKVYFKVNTNYNFAQSG